MSPKKTPPEVGRMDQTIAEALRNRERREKTSRERALKLLPWICGRCGREFTGKSTSHNVVEAAARAYLATANKAAYELKRVEVAAGQGSGSVHKNEIVDRLFPGGY